GAGPPRLEARGAEAVFALGFGRLDRLLPERRGRRGRRVVDEAGRAVGFTPEAALRGLADLAREAEGQLEKDGADELVQGDHAEEHRREDAARLAEVATDDRGERERHAGLRDEAEEADAPHRVGGGEAARGECGARPDRPEADEREAGREG